MTVCRGLRCPRRIFLSLRNLEDLLRRAALHALCALLGSPRACPSKGRAPAPQWQPEASEGGTQIDQRARACDTAK